MRGIARRDWSGGSSVRRCCAGAILLEMMVALAIFVMAGLAIGGAVRQGMVLSNQSRLEARASDLARTAMALIESGIESPLSLQGPVRPWLSRADAWDGDEQAEDEQRAALGVDESSLEDSGWELVIDTEPSEFRGLTKVSVTAQRVDEVEGTVLATVTLVQLVAMGPEGEDTVGEASDLLREAMEGAAAEERRTGTPRGSRP